MSIRNQKLGFNWVRCFTILLLIGILSSTGSATAFAQGTTPPPNPDDFATLPKSLSAVPKMGNGSAVDKTIKGNDVFTAATSSIINGDFEQGRFVGWSEGSTHGWAIVVPVTSTGIGTPSGTGWAVAWLGGENNDTSYISQGNLNISVQTTLRLWYYIGSEDACGYDYGYVQINSNTIYTWYLCSATNTGGWVMLDLDLSAYIGQSVTLSIMAITDGSLNSNLFIDDVYLLPTISGNVGAAGVTLSYTDGTAKTVTSQADGSYSLPVSNNWSGTVTPTHPCFTFSPANTSYINVTSDQGSQNYTPTIIPASGCANINVDIGGVIRGIYGLQPQGSMRQNYAGVDSGPVKVESTNAVPIIAAIRDAWAVNGVTTSFSQLMGLPLSQVSDKYVFPGYNNVTLNEQLRIANVDTVQTTVTVTIGGVLQGTYTLYPPGSLLGPSAVRVNYAGVDSGPVIVEGTAGVDIISAIRDAWAVNGVTKSFIQFMGLPAGQLSNKYVFPAYNNVTLNEQLRIANVDTVQTTVTVTIGGVLQGTYTLYPPGSLLGPSAVRVNYAGVDSGPVVVEGTAGVDIISSIRDAWAVNGVTTSFSQLMGVPAEQLSNKYVFPAYNNVTLNDQLRISNVDTVASTVTVTIGGVLQGTYTLYPPGSLLGPSAVRVNYAGLDSGPVVVEGTAGVEIISAIREAWAVNGVTQSFVQLMGLPAGQLSTTYLFPAYNNVTLNEQLRFGVP